MHVRPSLQRQGTRPQPPRPQFAYQPPGQPSPLLANLAPTTLVLYSFRNDDPEAYGNLLFFVKHGMHGCGACEYVLVVTPEPGAPEVALPRLPVGARYVHHTENCRGWGAFDWVFKREAVHITKYSYFIFLSSAVRGPFLPPYVKDKVHFADAMTSKLVGDVKMAGATISCEAAAPLASGAHHRNPHAQSSAVATDAVGMALLLRAGRVFACHRTQEEAVVHSELGASAAILAAGYNLDCFMGRFQGVDWRKPEMWGCNGGENPLSAGRVDGVSLAPMELMFVPVRHNMLHLRYPSAVAAAAYDAWYNGSLVTDMRYVQKSLVAEHFWEYRAPFVLAMAAVGPQCFDCDYYRYRYTDLAKLSCWNAFIHFVNHGQFEMRTHRFTCETPLTDRAVPFAPADDGRPWPRITQSGCRDDGACGGTTTAGSAAESLRVAAEDLRRQVEALRAKRDALELALDGAVAGGVADGGAGVGGARVGGGLAEGIAYSDAANRMASGDLQLTGALHGDVSGAVAAAGDAATTDAVYTGAAVAAAEVQGGAVGAAGGGATTGGGSGFGDASYWGAAGGDAATVTSTSGGAVRAAETAGSSRSGASGWGALFGHAVR